MGYDYDRLYAETKNALGTPTQVFVDYFNALPTGQLRVLDVGCGQGRDALFVARLGHSVFGVDLSSHGVRDMLDAAHRERLDITGTAADITSYVPDGHFDVILFDRTLHMLEDDSQREVLTRLLGHVATSGRVLIADEPGNMARFKDVIERHDANWTIERDDKSNLFVTRD